MGLAGSGSGAGGGRNLLCALWVPVSEISLTGSAVWGNGKKEMVGQAQEDGEAQGTCNDEMTRELAVATS
eukprot:6312067-Ditylum_brightwellii.AAC.1